MKVATLKVLLFVALLAVPTCGRLLTESNVEEQPAVENANVENQPPAVEKQEEVPATENAEVKAPETGAVEAPAENKEAQPVADQAKVEAPVAKDAPQPEKKRSNVGLFILIGVSVLGVIAIGTTFILGKQKN